MALAKISPLSSWLENLSQEFNTREFLETDPIGIVHEFSHTDDQEVVAFLCALFAFGNVKAIRKHLEKLLDPLGPRPAQFFRNANEKEVLKIAKSLHYRFIHPKDHELFLLLICGLIREFGNLEQAFQSLSCSPMEMKLKKQIWKHEPALELLLRLQPRLLARSPKTRGLRFLLADPLRSAGKRWHLFLRWMVRKDEIDLGLWSILKPADLILPLDTHLHQICSQLKFTKRKQMNSLTALEITKRLRTLNAEDPLRYDFALCRLGILKLKDERLSPLKGRAKRSESLVTFGPASNEKI